MAKHSASIECSGCANICTVYGTFADTVQFCPFCGDGVLLAYDDVDDETLLGGAYDDRDDDEDTDEDD